MAERFDEAEAAEVEAIRAERPFHNIAHNLSPALLAILATHPQAYMVGPDGLILPEYASLTTEEVMELADRLD